MENKKVTFITLGCKVNQYETNAMCEKFINKGYEVVEKEEKADIYIVNTCTVTNMSDRKSRQMLRRVKEINEKAIIVACGCYAQVAKEELEKIDEIDIVLGNNEKKNIVDMEKDPGKKCSMSTLCYLKRMKRHKKMMYLEIKSHYAKMNWILLNI